MKAGSDAWQEKPLKRFPKDYRWRATDGKRVWRLKLVIRLALDKIFALGEMAVLQRRIDEDFVFAIR